MSVPQSIVVVVIQFHSSFTIFGEMSPRVDSKGLKFKTQKLNLQLLPQRLVKGASALFLERQFGYVL
jgi:hypothetical protein